MRTLVKLAIVAAVALLPTGASAQEPAFAEFGPFKLYVAADATCAPRMKLRVEAAEASDFDNDPDSLGKLMAGARSALGFSCAGITDILIDGTHDGTSVYAGVTSEGAGWSIIKVPLATVTAAPAEAAPTEAVPNYHFSGLIEAIAAGNLRDIPDDQETRSQVGSILRAFTEECGEAPAEVALRAARYISPQLREMERNPGQGIANMLMDLANMRDRALDSGDFTGAWTDYANKNAAFRTEGMHDGKVFVVMHGCLSPEYGQFTRQLYSLIVDRSGRDPARYDEVEFSRMMSPWFREEMNFADPTEALRARQLAAMVDTGTAACAEAFDKPGFCGCVIENLKTAQIGDEVWAAIGSDFRTITRYPELRPHVAACY